MLHATLPDLNRLDAEALRVLIVTQHQDLVSTQDRLTATEEQLRSRESEIEHLKLLIAKLHRMQFGRKSEKLGQQIEQRVTAGTAANQRSPGESECPDCGGKLKKLGEEVSEMLEYLPACFVVIRQVRAETKLHRRAG